MNDENLEGLINYFEDLSKSLWLRREGFRLWRNNGVSRPHECKNCEVWSRENEIYKDGKFICPNCKQEDKYFLLSMELMEILYWHNHTTPSVDEEKRPWVIKKMKELYVRKK